MNQVQRLFGRTIYVRRGPEPSCPDHPGDLTFTLGGWRCDWPVSLPPYIDRWGIERQEYVACGYRPRDNRPVEVETVPEWDE